MQHNITHSTLCYESTRDNLKRLPNQAQSLIPNRSDQSQTRTWMAEQPVTTRFIVNVPAGASISHVYPALHSPFGLDFAVDRVHLLVPEREGRLGQSALHYPVRHEVKKRSPVDRTDRLRTALGGGVDQWRQTDKQR